MPMSRTAKDFLGTMIRKAMIWAAVMCFIACAYCARGFAQAETNPQLEGDMARLDALRSTSTLDSIRTQIDKDADKWRKLDRNAYVQYMLRACGTLSSYDIGDTTQRALLLSEYSMSVLASGELPLQEQVQFVEFLSLDPMAFDQAAWKSLRSRKTRLWLEAWRRLTRAVDANFDFNDRPVLNVSPPRSTGLPSGVSPAAIKDPQLRAEYENAIAQNFAKAQRYNQQNWLKINASSFYQEAERYVVNAYTRTPSDLEELQRHLSKYVDDPAARERFLEGVRKSQPH
jgi:hypothetical protein